MSALTEINDLRFLEILQEELIDARDKLVEEHVNILTGSAPITKLALIEESSNPTRYPRSSSLHGSKFPDQLSQFRYSFRALTHRNFKFIVNYFHPEKLEPMSKGTANKIMRQVIRLIWLPEFRARTSVHESGWTWKGLNNQQEAMVINELKSIKIHGISGWDILGPHFDRENVQIAKTIGAYQTYEWVQSHTEIVELIGILGALIASIASAPAVVAGGITIYSLSVVNDILSCFSSTRDMSGDITETASDWGCVATKLGFAMIGGFILGSTKWIQKFAKSAANWPVVKEIIWLLKKAMKLFRWLLREMIVAAIGVYVFNDYLPGLVPFDWRFAITDQTKYDEWTTFIVAGKMYLSMYSTQTTADSKRLNAPLSSEEKKQKQRLQANLESLSIEPASFEQDLLAAGRVIDAAASGGNIDKSDIEKLERVELLYEMTEDKDSGLKTISQEEFEELIVEDWGFDGFAEPDVNLDDLSREAELLKDKAEWGGLNESSSLLPENILSELRLQQLAGI